MKQIVSFGETLLRLTPSIAFERLEQTQTLKMGFAGAESNVCCSLANFGQQAFYVTALPGNKIGDACMRHLQMMGVDTRFVVRSEDRMGTYFIEAGATPRPYRIIYDREHSAISRIKPGTFDWDNMLEGKDWIHLTGITPALSEQCAAETILAAKTARSKGVKVSFDLNFRRKLWSDASKARGIFEEIIQYTDVLIANAGALNDVFGWQSPETQDEGQVEMIGYITKTFGIDTIGITVRKETAANLVGALLYQQGKTHHSQWFPMEMTERLGGGDAFAAALVHGLVNEWAEQKTIDFSAAAFALKHTIPGDILYTSEQEILQLVEQGNAGSHVER
ncbi:MAG: sugar kinase [Cyclobacteriaceae bacterium]|nr:sugar kinase [Cyclobacteriaceae bacterium]